MNISIKILHLKREILNLLSNLNVYRDRKPFPLKLFNMWSMHVSFTDMIYWYLPIISFICIRYEGDQEQDK